MSLKIGITERGDAGLDLTWSNKLREMDGVIVITKNINNAFIDKVCDATKPIIVHATCTGYGSTQLEPRVPNMLDQIESVKKLICAGFPARNIVFRVDPIFPTQKGIKKFHEVMSLYISDLKPMGVDRVRISILDEYKHVKQRFNQQGWNCIYTGNIPDAVHIKMVAIACMKYKNRFESCAELLLSKIANNVYNVGCVSYLDLGIMGLNSEEKIYTNPQGRRGCKCLSCKTELLNNRSQCQHGCVYCYWKGNCK